MKTYCKDIDITNIDLISEAVYECIAEKLCRRDTLELLASYSDKSATELKELIRQEGRQSVYPLVDKVIEALRSEIINENLNLKPICYRRKIDTSSGKERNIAIQNIKQQMYDYIAVKGLEPILKRIGEFQCAAIKGRGSLYGAKRINRWMRNLEIRYGAKADVKKCYENISHENLMAFLRKYVRNDKLLWLVESLLNTFKKGLSIGSYLSQYLCNLYMSQLYHYVMECLYKERKQKDGTVKRIRLVHHALFYVDDILILGTNKKDIKKAMALIIKYVEKLGLSIKPTWITFKVRLKDRKNEKGQFIDMMGYRIYRFHITIRRRIFKRIRKYYCRCLTKIKKGKMISLSLARKCISYYGYIKNTDSFKIIKKYKVAKIVKVCRRRISNESKIFREAKAC